MKLEIEYPIALEGIPKRSSRRKLVLVRDTYVVDIPEYSSAQMPIAFKENAPGGDIVFRAMDGKLFTAAKPPVIEDGRVGYEFGHRDNGKRSPIFHSQAHGVAIAAVDCRSKKLKSSLKTGIYPEGVASSHAWANAFRNDRSPPPPVKLPFLSDGTVSDYDTAEVERARARIREVCDRAVLCAGRFMVPRSEPVYEVDTEVYEDRPRVRLVRDFDPRKFSRDEDAQEPKFGKMMFALDELDMAREFASEMWRLRTGQTEEACVEGNTVELLDSSCLAFDAEVAAAANVARIMQDRYAASLSISVIGTGWSSRLSLRTKLAELETDGFIAFQAISRSLEIYENGADGADLCDTVRQALSSSGGSRFLLPDDMAHAELALGRWEKRHSRREFGFTF